MRIRMLHSRAATENGCTIRLFNEGTVYTVTDDLGRLLISCGDAVEISRPGVETREMKNPVSVGETIPISQGENTDGGAEKPNPRPRTRRGKR